MTARIAGATRSTRGRLSQFGPRKLGIFAALPVIAALVLTFAVAGSGGAPDPTCTTMNHVTGSNFEIDVNANLKVDGAANCIDWLNGGANSTFRSDVAKKNDTQSGPTDESFGQGTKEDTADPTIVNGSIPPNKSDLKVFGVLTETTTAGKFLELFWSRVNSPQGTTNMDFELNQKFCDSNANPTNCSTNNVTPIRTDGDKLVTYDLSKGGTVPVISIRSWNAAGSAWGPATVISGGANASALGSVNTSTIPANEAGGAQPAGIGAQDPFQFGEAALKFSALFPSGGGCGAFGSAYLKSRSADSFNSELKDFIPPEKVTISNCTTITTSLSANPITVGDSVHDSATLNGASGDAGGTVTYTVYDNNTCTSNANDRDAGTKTVTNGVVPDSNSLQFNSAGTFYWQASYSGDLNNAASKSDCTSETLVVNKAKPSIATTLSASSITVGDSVHDSATLSNATSNAGGTVTYTVYDNNTCTSNTNDRDAGTKTVTNGVVPDSNSLQFNTPGTFYWQASYSGDANNESAKSVCTSETLVVNKAASSIATSQFVYPNDTSTVSEAVTGNITGDVKFRLFNNLVNCQNDDGTASAAGLLYSETVPLPAASGNSKGVSTSNTSVKVSADATVYWKVIYGGDAQHNGRISNCVENTAVDFTDDPGPGDPGP
jgi:hypothetical protein